LSLFSGTSRDLHHIQCFIATFIHPRSGLY
jgi:hypothetical protein